MTFSIHPLIRLGFVTVVLFAGILLFANSALAVSVEPPYPCGGSIGYGGGGDCAGAGYTVALSATPEVIEQGQTSRLTWLAWGAQSCSIDNGVGTVTNNGGAEVTGWINVAPNTTTTYTITCTWNDMTVPGGTATLSDDAMVTVIPAPPPPVTATLQANPENIQQGDSSTLTWSSTNATSCTGTNFSTGGATGGTSQVSPSITTTYSVSCIGQGGTATAYATVTVTAPTCPSGQTWNGSSCVPTTPPTCPSGQTWNGSSCVTTGGGDPPTCSLSAAGATVPTTLSWSSTNAASCVGGGFSTGGATSGSVSVSATGNYTLSCTGSGGTCPLEVEAVGTPSCGTASAHITANPNRVRADNNSGTTLTFSATGVDSGCTVSGPGVNQVASLTSCVVESQTLTTPQITEQSVYTINCDSGEGVAQAVVNLIPKFIEF